MQHENLDYLKNKQALLGIKRLTDAGVPIEKVVEYFIDSPGEIVKMLAISEASQLIKAKAISFSRLITIYECSPDTFHIFCNELQELYSKSSEKYFQMTKNNWDFFAHFISCHKTPKDFEALYDKSPKEFKKLSGRFS